MKGPSLPVSWRGAPAGGALAALVVAPVEVAWAWSASPGLSLSGRLAAATFVAASLLGAGALGGGLFALVARAGRTWAGAAVAGLAALLPGAVLLPGLLAGGWIRQQSWAWPAALLLLLAVGLLVAGLARRLCQAPPGRSWLALGLGALGALSFGANRALLPGLYPAVHAALLAAALLGIAGAGACLWRPGRGGLALGALLLVPLVGLALRADAMAWGAVTRGPELGRRAAQGLARLGLGPSFGEAASSLAQRAPLPWPEDTPRPDLAGADIVLITVDALRADRLGVYGSSKQLTPHLDALAREGAFFTRAYAPSPTSSYSLTSLFSARYAHGRMPHDPGPWRTLAEQLSQHGYRSYATYNEGIFFTDGDRFAHYRDRAFGFQHRRVAYLDAYDISRGGAAALQDGDGPAFVWLHLAEPHEPYQVRPGFHRGDSPEDRYDAEIAYADRHLEQILRPLAQRKAIVILTADHGEAFGEHGAFYHTSDVYAEQSWVPLIVWYPGITPRQIDAPATLIDIAPTLLDLLQLPPLPGAEGRSFAPLLAGQAPDAGPVFSEWGARRAVAQGDLRLRCDLDMDACELFDLRADPLERRDLSASRPQDAARLRGVLRAFVRQQAASPGSQAASQLADLASGDLGALPGALDALSDPDPTTRAQAAALLGEFADHDSCARLWPLLRDPSQDVRAAALLSLGKLGDLGVAPLLREALSDPDPVYRGHAAVALALLGDAHPLELSLGLLSPDQDTQRATLHLLDALGDAARREDVVIARVSDLLSAGPLAPEAAALLARFGAVEAAPALVAALRGATQIPARAAFVDALASLQSPAALDALAERAAFGEGGPAVGEAILACGGRPPRFGAGGPARLATHGDAWRCQPDGCALLAPEGELRFLAPKPLADRPYTLLLSARGEGTFTLLLNGVALGSTTLLDEPRDLRFPIPSHTLRPGKPALFTLQRQGKVSLRLAMLLPIPDDPSTRY